SRLVRQLRPARSFANAHSRSEATLRASRNVCCELVSFVQQNTRTRPPRSRYEAPFSAIRARDTRSSYDRHTPHVLSTRGQIIRVLRRSNDGSTRYDVRSGNPAEQSHLATVGFFTL